MTLFWKLQICNFYIPTLSQQATKLLMHKIEQCVLDHYLEVTGLILTRLPTEGNACKKSPFEVL